MKRRLVLASCLLGIVGAGASTAFATTPGTPTVSPDQHQICVVTSSDDNHRNTQDYCVAVNLPRVPPPPALP